MTDHWTLRFLDVAYERDGEGPRAFNCWTYFRHVQLEQFGRWIEAIDRPDGRIARLKLFRDRPDSFGWRKVAADLHGARLEARSGDPVLMTCKTHPHHIGIWVDDVGGGSVLHCCEGAGAALQSPLHLEMGDWRITGVYRPIEDMAGEERT